jgi:hypothetical protein
MRYDLRTLLIAGAVGPPAIAACYWFICYVLGMEDWKFALAMMGLIAGFYCLRDVTATEQCG